MRYPAAPRASTVDVIHGEQVADPYRWLEAASAATREWVAAQDDLAAGYFAGQEAPRERFLTLLRDLAAGEVTLPVAAGQRRFYRRAEPDAEHAPLLVADAAGERVLLDPAVMSPDQTTTLDAFHPSPDGQLVAYQYSDRGDDRFSLAVLDVDSSDANPGETVYGPVDVAFWGEVAWLPGGFCLQYAGGDAVGQAVYRHWLDGRPAERVFAPTLPEAALSASPDGRWLAVATLAGSMIRNDVHLVDLAAGPGDPARITTVHEGLDCLTRPRFGPDGRLYLHTTLDAPTWRLAVADLAHPQPGHWRDLVGAGPDVLVDYAAVSGELVVVHRRDVIARVSVYDAATGKLRRTLALPGDGDVQVGGGDGGAWLRYTDHRTPPRLLRYRTGDDALSPGPAATPSTLDDAVAAARVEQLFATSADGTRVPMFVLSRADRTGPRPTILEGYGGWNVTWAPAYAPHRLAWVLAGGVYVLSNLRGGGEYGADWFLAGMRGNAQNPVDDYLACAAALCGAGYTTPEQLGASGGSKGGLTVGAAVTQRPDAFRAAAIGAPVLDMVRYEGLGVGRIWADGFGTADDPEQFRWLRDISAYHRVRDGVAYPAVLFTVFDHDLRVDPAHARKMCAALQHATTTSRPILLCRKSDMGHGGRSASRQRDVHAGTLTFLADQLGLRDQPGKK